MVTLFPNQKHKENVGNIKVNGINSLLPKYYPIYLQLFTMVLNKSKGLDIYVNYGKSHQSQSKYITQNKHQNYCLSLCPGRSTHVNWRGSVG